MEQEGATPKLLTKLGTLSNISWCAEALTVPFTGTKRPSPATVLELSSGFYIKCIRNDEEKVHVSIVEYFKYCSS